MRKFLVAAILPSFFALGSGASRAAPEALRCTEKFDPLKRPATPGTIGSSMNCLADEVFILDGAELVDGGPLVDCAEDLDMQGGKDPKNCFISPTKAGYLSIDTLEKRVVGKALELLRTKVPQLPEWDEIVVFTTDFGPEEARGPLFYRIADASFRRINPVTGIGPVAASETTVRDPARPYVAMISAGMAKSIPTKPDTEPFAPCQVALPTMRQPIDRLEQRFPAVCPPQMASYFDALAQVTAMLYGPYLRVDSAAHGGNLLGRPALKSALVTVDDGRGNASEKLEVGPETSVWSGFLDTRGSLLGGNTFVDNGNRTWSVVRPPPFQGVSAPFEGKPMLRFQPLDLYVMGFLPDSAVPALRSFMHAAPGNIAQPEDFGVNWVSSVGPNMGTRPSGVTIRAVATPSNKAVPKTIPFGEIAGFNGPRNPSYADARQHIRQLWVIVTKPEAVIDFIAGSKGGAKREDQLKEQTTQVANVQKHRRAFNQYFYALTGYRGKLISSFEGDIDDGAYFEFAGARDDEKIFQEEGSLKRALPGPEEIPNSGGKLRTVLRVTSTKGADGRIRFNPGAHPLRIEGRQDVGPAPNNLLTVRMRVPSNPGLLAELKKDPGFEGGFYGSFVFEGGGKSWTVRLPKLGEAFLVPDGKFRNYSVDLSSEPDFTAGTWTSFAFVPSNREASNIEIEFIKIGFSENVKDSDKSCSNVDQPDGWLGLEDNCPSLFNPSQEDGNDDGVGDACEDYDSDSRLNACDNCPTTSNTSQRDGNDNRIGDACDTSTSDGCFSGAAIAGPAPRTSAFFWVSATILGAMVVVTFRRRRRSRKAPWPGPGR